MEESTRNKFIICLILGGLLLSIAGFAITYVGYNYDKIFPNNQEIPSQSSSSVTPFATPLITPSHTHLIIRHLK